MSELPEDELALIQSAKTALALSMTGNFVCMLACWCLYFFPLAVGLGSALGALGAFMGYAIHKREPSLEADLYARFAMAAGVMSVIDGLFVGLAVLVWLSVFYYL